MASLDFGDNPIYPITDKKSQKLWEVEVELGRFDVIKANILVVLRFEFL